MNRNKRILEKILIKSMPILAILTLCLPFVCAYGYTKDLSKLQSDTPNRYPLAFFVPDSWSSPQLIQSISTKQFPQFDKDVQTPQGKTIISMMSNSSHAYDGATLQNKIANWRICRAVSLKTESEPHHPMFVSNTHSVVLTQNFKGGYHA